VRIYTSELPVILSVSAPFTWISMLLEEIFLRFEVQGARPIITYGIADAALSTQTCCASQGCPLQAS